MIHPTAVIDPRAELASDVEVGPYCLIEGRVEIGPGTRVGSQVRICSGTRIGPSCVIESFAVIGGAPQDLKYRDEPTELIIGPNNHIREFVTIHRGTQQGGGRTIIGSDNFFMAYAHVAHDCRIGNHVIMANASTLAGHILIEDHAIIGGLAAVHQYVRIGAYALVSGLTGVPRDVPPYTLAAGNRARLYGLNTVGLRRHGFSNEIINAIKKAYRIIFRSKKTLQHALEEVRSELGGIEEVDRLISFMENSKRGFCRSA
jgi:UDP-N-acetylglucosamine acyltransferase